MKMGVPCRREIENRIVADMQDLIRRQIQRRSGEAKDLRIRFGMAHFTRNEDGIEEAGEVKPPEQRPETPVPV